MADEKYVGWVRSDMEYIPHAGFHTGFFVRGERLFYCRGVVVNVHKRMGKISCDHAHFD